MKRIKDLKKGELFTLKRVEAKQKDIYVRGSYIPQAKRYCCHKYDDVCRERLFKGDKIVIDEFYTLDEE